MGCLSDAPAPVCVRVSVCVCVRAFVRAYERAYVRVCVCVGTKARRKCMRFSERARLCVSHASVPLYE